MLSRKIPKLRLGLKCKGDSNNSPTILKKDSFSLKNSKLGKYILNGFPVLSIFALLGISLVGLFSLALFGVLDLSGFGVLAQVFPSSGSFSAVEKAYAATYTESSGESSVSLAIGGAGEKEQVSTGRGVVAYRSHTVRVQANTVKDYGLTISGPANMTAPSGGTTIAGVSNKTGTEMGSSTTYDNTWGYGWGATSTSDSGLVYRTLSTTGTNLLTVNGTSDKPVLSNRAVDFTRKLVFAVKFGENAVAGRYYANVTLSLTATPSTITTYSITYNGNSNTSGTAPAKQEQKTYDTASYSFTASTQGTLARSGYNFLGWSTSPTATSAEYAAGSTVSLTQSAPTKTLYAVWEPAVTGFGGIKRMQDMTVGICNSVSSGTSGQLYDVRDDSIYTIRKLSDGRCWMTQNLRIVSKTISPADSNITSGNFSIPNAASGFTGTNNNAAYYSNNINYGAYYSWYTATAGTGTSSISSGNASGSICPKGWKLPNGTLGTNTNDFARAAGLSSINVAAATDYWSNLSSPSFASNALTVNNVTWPAAGYYNNSSSNMVGSLGGYWSSTVVNGTSVYNLSFGSNNFYPAGRSDKYSGLSVRCVIDNSTPLTLTYDANGGSGTPDTQTCSATGTNMSCYTTISSTQPSRTGYSFLGWNSNADGTGTSYNAGASMYLSSDKTLYAQWKQEFKITSGFTSISNLQQLTSTICKNEALGATKDLKDTRDSNTYTVTKLDDGNCWMTQNLRIVNKTITPTDSNVSSNYTIPASAIWYRPSDVNTYKTTEGAYYDSSKSANGAYYSFYTATAGTSSALTSGNSAQYDICPRNWHLPTLEEYYTLVQSATGTNLKITSISAIGASMMLNNPYNFILSGYSSNGPLTGIGTEGSHWTSTAHSESAKGYSMDNSSSRFFAIGSNRSSGLSVRCVVISN